MNVRLGPLLAWLAIQLLTLWIGAMRLPLTARSGSEPQHLAFVEMIVVEVAVSTLLFPILMQGWTAIAMALTALPFLQLAAFLTATPATPQIAVSLAIVLWIIGLRLWASALRSSQEQLIAVAVLNCFVIGGPILSYLIREFSDFGDQTLWSLPTMCDPLTALIRQASLNSFTASSLSAPALLIASGAIATASRRSFSTAAKLST